MKTILANISLVLCVTTALHSLFSADSASCWGHAQEQPLIATHSSISKCDCNTPWIIPQKLSLGILVNRKCIDLIGRLSVLTVILLREAEGRDARQPRDCRADYYNGRKTMPTSGEKSTIHMSSRSRDRRARSLCACIVSEDTCIGRHVCQRYRTIQFNPRLPGEMCMCILPI